MAMAVRAHQTSRSWQPRAVKRVYIVAVTVTMEATGAAAAGAEPATVSVTVLTSGIGVAAVLLTVVPWLPAAPIPTPTKQEMSIAAIPPPITRGSGTPRFGRTGGGVFGAPGNGRAWCGGPFTPGGAR
jgi:hypothetical protein